MGSIGTKSLYKNRVTGKVWAEGGEGRHEWAEGAVQTARLGQRWLGDAMGSLGRERGLKTFQPQCEKTGICHFIALCLLCLAGIALFYILKVRPSTSTKITTR